MSDDTKRTRTTEPPVQGGGFVTNGEDDAWTQQDPDTWARMGKPGATPHRPATERRTAHRPPTSQASQLPSVENANGSHSGANGSNGADVGLLSDEPQTVVGGPMLRRAGPRAGPAPTMRARPDGKPFGMEIVTFDSVGSRAAPPAGAEPAHSEDGGPSRWSSLFPGYPPIRIVRRTRKEAAFGRVLVSVGVIVGISAFLWHQYEGYLASQVPASNSVIYTVLDEPPVEEAVPSNAEGATAGSASTPAPPPPDAASVATAPVGTLSVRSNRVASVYVDGRPAGQAPLETVRIVKGRHEIRIVDEESLDSRTQIVEIEAGHAKVVSITF